MAGMAGIGMLMQVVTSLAGAFMGGGKQPKMDTSGMERAAQQQAEATRQQAIALQNQNKQQQLAMETQNRQAEIQQAQSRIQGVRQTRIKAAQIQSAADNQGVAFSSAAAGGIGSVQSQGASNQGVSTALGELENVRIGYLNTAADFATQAIGFGADAQAAAIQGSIARDKAQASIVNSQGSGGFGSILTGLGQAASSLFGGRTVQGGSSLFG